MSTQTFRFREFEEAVFHLEQASSPWNLLIEVGATDTLDLSRLDRAIRTAAARHPLARARLQDWSRLDRSYRWLVPDSFDLDPLNAVDCPDPERLAEIRANLASAPIPLSLAPGFRVVLAHGRVGDTVLFAFSNVAFDSVGAYRFVQSVASAYRSATDPSDVVPIEVARALDKRLSATDWREWTGRALQSASRLVDGLRGPSRVATQGESPHPGSGVVIRQLGSDQTDLLLHGRPDRATLNDVLLAGLQLTIDRWNSERGSAVGRISLLVPVNTRPSDWFWDGVGNYTSMASVSTDSSDRVDLATATAAIAAQTEPVHRAQQSAGLFDLMGIGKRIPVGVKQALPALLPLTGNRLVDSAVLSNLGRVPSAPYFDGSGPTSVYFSPPAALPIGVSVGAVTVAGSVHLSLRYLLEQFDAEAAEAFTDLLLEQLGVTAAVSHQVSSSQSRPELTSNAPVHAEHRVAVIGAGFAGLCAAIKLKEAGINKFVLFEKADDIGGTWRDNIYPGCACDVPSHLYSFSFEPNPNWSRMFAPQAEIWAYQRHCVEKYELTPHLRLGSEVVRLEWDDDRLYWRITTRDGQVTTAKVVISAVGALSIPAYPRLNGIEKFEGTAFHSARWDHDFDFGGKTVAVVGTGSSAIQFVPKIAPLVEKLTLFQRTPPWVMSKPDREMTDIEQKILANIPLAQRVARSGIYVWMESRVLGLAVDPRAMKVAEIYARRHIDNSIDDPELRAKVTPDYTLGCKRILMSDEYYPTLNRGNVEVVTESIAEIGPHGITTDDRVVRQVDAIVYGTGFHVSDPIGPMQVVGKGGVEIRDSWKEGSGMEAYLGVSVAGFPNFFMLLGPNTGLGHTSIIFMIESQVNYALQAVQMLGDDGLDSLDIKAEVQREFNDGLQQKLDGAVWSAGGCESWYLDEFGKNRTLWPSFTFEYWYRTRNFEPELYT
ncbi:NAD(P)-binding domain-containing protein [Antrihabitans spumae]|uniref:NAD(P)-binding domain-containing protein n=1 Tax=Antrihabitans spumae TaxID=3373370 RepID=A0ABW7K2B4_9NOCA